MKKVISFIMVAVIMLSSLCVTSFAATPSVGISVSYGNGYSYVTISTKSGTVYYTTDGSVPTNKSTKYTGKFKVTKPLKVRAVLYQNGKKVKNVYKTVAVRTKTPTVKEYSNSSSEVARYKVTGAKNALFYYTTDGTTPSKSNGKLVVDNSISITKNCTLKIIAVQSGWKNSTVKTVKVTGIIKPEEYEQEVLRLVNVERKKKGLSPLTTTTALGKAADVRAKELKTLFSHDRPDGSSCFTVLDDYNIDRWASGENIAYGYRTPSAVVEGWMNSDGHRAKILNSSYTKMGVGYVTGSDGRAYWVQIFIG